MESIDKCPMPKKRNLGIDLLKAILAIMIMARHSAVISAAPVEGAGAGTLVPLVKFAYYSLQNMCVPVFMIVSLYFYTQKRTVNKSYFKKRIGRLLQILCFWWPVYYLLTRFTSFPLVPNSVLGVFLMPFLSGALYFLGGLVFCVLCIEIIMRVKEKLPERYENQTLISFTIIGFALSTFLRDFPPYNSALLTQIIGMGPLTFFDLPCHNGAICSLGEN